MHDPMLLEHFARATDAASNAVAGVDDARAAAFIDATIGRIRAEERRRAWHRVAAVTATVAAVLVAAVDAGEFAPISRLLPDLASTFGHALASPPTWAAAVITLLALRSLGSAVRAPGP